MQQNLYFLFIGFFIVLCVVLSAALVVEIGDHEKRIRENTGNIQQIVDFINKATTPRTQ